MSPIAADREAPLSAPWTARVLTLFPEMFPGPLGLSLAGKALERGIWALDVLDIRDFARDKHRAVDDAPFGGGAGMVMRPDVLDAALVAAKGSAAKGLTAKARAATGTPVVTGMAPGIVPRVCATPEPVGFWLIGVNPGGSAVPAGLPAALKAEPPPAA